MTLQEVVHGHFGGSSLVAILNPVVKALGLTSSIISIGFLLAIAFFIEEKKGFLQKEADRVRKLAQLAMLVWITTLVGSIFVELSVILDTDLLRAFSPNTVRSFLQQTVIGKTFLGQIVSVLVVIVLTYKAKKIGAIYWGIGFGLLALILPVFQSHSSSLGNHSLAIGSLVIHVIFIALWVGGVFGLIVIAPKERAISLQRFSSLALWCAIAVSVSGAINAFARLNFASAWSSPYASLVIAKIALTGLLIAFGAKHRKFIIQKKPDETFSLLGVELVVMVLTIAVGAWLSTLQPPEHPTSATLPPKPTLSHLLWGYSPDALFLGILILVTALYIRGVMLLSRRGDKWPVGRTIAFICGVAATDYATSGGIGIYAQYAFSYHMIAHMIIGMIAPIGFVLSAPITLALRTLPQGRTEGERGIRGLVISLIHSKSMAFYTNPVVVLAIFDGSLFLLYMTPLFSGMMHSHSGHIVMNLHFLLAGYLFFHVIIGVDPNPRKVPHIVRIIILFAAMSIHAFFSIALLSTTTLLDGGYFASLGRLWNTDYLLDQHIGGSIGWAMGEIPILIALVATFIQWVRDDSREAKRIDRSAERAAAMGEVDELGEYNKYLASLQEIDKRNGE